MPFFRKFRDKFSRFDFKKSPLINAPFAERWRALFQTKPFSSSIRLKQCVEDLVWNRNF